LKRNENQSHIEYLFSTNGVKYPGTREAYVGAHPGMIIEDTIAFLDANRDTIRKGYIIFGSLDREDQKIDTGEPFEVPDNLLKEWKIISLTKCEIYRIKNLKTGKYDYFEPPNIPMDPNKYDLVNKELFTKIGEAFQHALNDGWIQEPVSKWAKDLGIQNIIKEYALNIYNVFILREFLRGISLEQLRISLQNPLEVEYESLTSSSYSCDCVSPSYNTDCTIYFTFIDGILNDWTKIYVPHMRC
jgi:hypothetical protein